MSENHAPVVPAGEHEVHETFTVDIFYPDHDDRTESSVFRETKRKGHAADLRCSFSGQKHPEYHHCFVEWADTNAIDWHALRDIAIGKTKVLPVLDPVTDEPTDETFPVEQSFAWMVCKITEARGFDWHAFDPDKPELFVDSPQNMLCLSAKFHRHKGFGIHVVPLPILVVMGLPQKAGFIASPAEEVVS